MRFVSALRGMLAAVTLLVSMLAGGVAASAADFSFMMKNSHPNILEVELYSRSRNVVWPGNGEVYYLEDRDTNQIHISCNQGEYICYGAWVTGNPDGTYWGVGAGGKKGCNGCCWTCDNGGQTRLITLTD